MVEQEESRMASLMREIAIFHLVEWPNGIYWQQRRRQQQQQLIKLDQ